MILYMAFDSFLLILIPIIHTIRYILNFCYQKAIKRLLSTVLIRSILCLRLDKTEPASDFVVFDVRPSRRALLAFVAVFDVLRTEFFAIFIQLTF